MNNPDPVEVFRVEAREVLERMEQDLLDLAGRLEDRQLIDAVFRGLHTIKGSGAMFGFTALAEFTHHLETAFDRVRKGEAAASLELVSLVLEAQEHMGALLEGVENVASEGAAILKKLEDITSRNLDGGSTIAAKTAWRVGVKMPANAFRNGCSPLALLDELRGLGEAQVSPVLSGLPALQDMDPTSCYIAWDIVVHTDAGIEAIEDVFIFVRDEMELSIAEIKAVEPVETQDSESRNEETADPARMRRSVASESVRVPAERLDELMDRVGELVIAQSRLKQIAAASAEINIRAVSEEVERLASELRDAVMVMRMTPIGHLFGRFRRLVHDLSRETGKHIDLFMEGETTELDKNVIERLADPLIHIIRNSADHGIESADVRRTSGKSEHGRISLVAQQSGAEVVITVCDDGAGINSEKVRRKAESVGLIQPGAVLPEEDVLRLIFEPGFSTAAQVTSLSGRGVGMDVVKRTIDSLRGSIDVKSVPGQGSEIALRIPLTLAIIDGLLVRVGTGRFVIPLGAVEECVELSREQDLRSRGKNLLPVRGQLIPFLRLREVFRSQTEPDLYQKVVIISHGKDRLGLVVDQIIGDHQTVIKSLSKFHRDAGTFSGATILGDGAVALILDIERLVRAHATAEPQMKMAG